MTRVFEVSSDEQNVRGLRRLGGLKDARRDLKKGSLQIQGIIGLRSG
jgi:hypothetical protein